MKAEDFILTLEDQGSDEENLYHAMREFAKYHVKKAIEAAIEEAPSGSSTDMVTYEDVVAALKDCYPGSNIR